jgi:hypothetical protein
LINITEFYRPRPQSARRVEAREAEQMQKNESAEARKLLVERRSGLIRSLRLSQQSEEMEAHMDLIVRVQQVIDVIDRIDREEQTSP